MRNGRSGKTGFWTVVLLLGFFLPLMNCGQTWDSSRPDGTSTVSAGGTSEQGLKPASSGQDTLTSDNPFFVYLFHKYDLETKEIIFYAEGGFYPDSTVHFEHTDSEGSKRLISYDVSPSGSFNEALVVSFDEIEIGASFDASDSVGNETSFTLDCLMYEDDFSGNAGRGAPAQPGSGCGDNGTPYLQQ